MRLLIVSSEFPPGPGGIGTHANQLAMLLQEMGWDVLVLSPQDYAEEAEIAAFTAQLPFAFQRLGTYTSVPARILNHFRMLTNWLGEWHSDVVLASGRRAVWLSALCMVGHKGARLVAVGHGSEFRFGSWVTQSINRWAYQKADRLICVSDYTLREVRKAGIEPRAVSVVPNGADDQLYSRLPDDEVQGLREGWKLGRDPMILTVGNVSERKGHDLVIRALPTVLAAIPNVQYYIAGLPSRQPILSALASELGVADQVHFWGRVSYEALNELFNMCDVFVIPSRSTEAGDIEGYGIVVVEAALCGKPSIGTQESGLEEAIIDGETGLVVPQENVEALAQAMIDLLDNEERRGKMGQAAHERAHREQTWRLRVQEYDRLLRDQNELAE